MEQQWHYSNRGESCGPVPASTVQAMVDRGELDDSELVWSEGMGDWVPIGQVFPASGASAVGQVERPVAGGASGGGALDPYAPPEAQLVESQSDFLGMVTPRPKLDVGFCVSQAWNYTTSNFGILLGAFVVLIAIAFAISFCVSMGVVGVAMGAGGDVMLAQSLNLLGQIVQTAIQLFFTLGLVRMGLDVLDGKSVEIGTMFSQSSVYWKGFRATFLSFLLIFGAAIVCQAPVGFMFYRQVSTLQSGAAPDEAALLAMFGIGFVCLLPVWWLSVRLLFIQEAVVDQKLGARASIAYSWRLTQGNFWRLVLLGLAMGVVVLAGFLALLLGLLFAIPLMWMIKLVAYRYLQRGHA